MRTISDMNPKKIRYQLDLLGLTYAALDRANNFDLGTSRKAASVPIEAGERAIADVLGMHPKDIWPSRYESDGARLKPQPRENYQPGSVNRGRLQNINQPPARESMAAVNDQPQTPTEVA